MKHLKRGFEQYLPVDWLFLLDLQDLMANMEPLVTYGYLNLSKILKIWLSLEPLFVKGTASIL